MICGFSEQLAEDEGYAAGEGDEEDGGAEPCSVEEGADEAGQVQSQEDAGEEPADEFDFMTAELAGDNEPGHGRHRDYEEHRADRASKRRWLHLAEGEHERRTWQSGGDTGERNRGAGGHLDPRRTGYPKSAEERDGAGRGKAPHEEGDDLVTGHGQDSEAGDQAEREPDGAPAHGQAVGVVAFHDHIAEAHDLADDDERSRNKAGVDGHQGWSRHQGQTDPQTALGYGPGG